MKGHQSKIFILLASALCFVQIAKAQLAPTLNQFPTQSSEQGQWLAYVYNSLSVPPADSAQTLNTFPTQHTEAGQWLAFVYNSMQGGGSGVGKVDSIWRKLDSICYRVNGVSYCFQDSVVDTLMTPIGTPTQIAFFDPVTGLLTGSDSLNYNNDAINIGANAVLFPNINRVGLYSSSNISRGEYSTNNVISESTLNDNYDAYGNITLQSNINPVTGAILVNELRLQAQDSAGSFSQLDINNVPNGNIGIVSTLNSATLFSLNPTAGPGTTNHILNTSTSITSGNILEVQNHDTVKFAIDYNGNISPIPVPALPATQIPWGDVNGLMTSNSNLTFQDTVAFNINENGTLKSSNLNIQPNQANLQSNDNLDFYQSIILMTPQYQFLNSGNFIGANGGIVVDSGTVTLGDYNLSFNSQTLILNNAIHSCTINFDTIISPIATDVEFNGLNLNTSSHVYQFGDYQNTNNGTGIQVDDANGIIDIRNYLAGTTIGDGSNTASGTGSFAIGSTVQALNDNTIGLGQNVILGASNSWGFGYNIQASGSLGMCLGQTVHSYQNQLAMGFDSVSFQTSDTLHKLSIVHAGGTFTLYSPTGDTVKIANSSLKILSNGTVIMDDAVAYGYQYATPATTDTITANGKSLLVVNPAGTLAALSIIFPSSPTQGQTFNIAFTQIIASLTLLNGTILGGISSATANSSVKYQYVTEISKWVKN